MMGKEMNELEGRRYQGIRFVVSARRID